MFSVVPRLVVIGTDVGSVLCLLTVVREAAVDWVEAVVGGLVVSTRGEVVTETFVEVVVGAGVVVTV